MDTQGLFVASLLDSGSRVFASGAVLRVRGERGEAEVTEWGFEGLVADVEMRLRALSEALAAGEPELFALDVRWLASTWAARGVPTELLAATLRGLRDELDERLPGEAARSAHAVIERGLACLDAPAAPLESLLAAEAPHAELARRFLHAVLEGRRADAERLVLEAFESGVPVAELHRDVLVKAQAEMGRMWQTGEVNVAEEHLGTRVVESVLTLLWSRMPRAAANGRTVLSASVRGNLHDAGARVVADHFEMAGWRALLLGANTPAEDLVQAVADWGADLVALSAGTGLHVRATAELVEALRASGARVPVLVGGGPFAALPELWRAVGADASAPDAEAAVAAGERLVAGPGGSGGSARA